MEEELIGQMGLLLTQVRVTRLSLERIEASTATFGGLALSAASSSDRPAFGAPPMIDGALKVYVINVDDFVAPAGGGFFETILGGIGRFVGGLAGGVVGGVIGGAVLFPMVDRLASIADSIAGIVDRLVTTVGLTPEQWRELLLGGEDSDSGQAASQGSGPFDAFLQQLTPDHILRGLELLTHTVDALVFIIPMAAGAMAALLMTVSNLRGEIVSWIGFLLRNLLILRGVVVAIIGDITALLTPLIATIMGAVAQLVTIVFTGITFVVAQTVQASFEVARALATALTSVVNATLQFAVRNTTQLLNFLGGSTIVRLLAWFATALPAMLTALAAAAGRPMPSGQATNLARLSAQGAAVLSGPAPATPTVTPFAATDITDAINQDTQDRVVEELRMLGDAATTATVDIVDGVRDTVLAAVGAVETAVENSSARLRASLNTQLQAANRQIGRLDEIMTRAEEVATSEPPEMLGRIAASYGAWLESGGMNTLLSAMTEHFANAPTGADGQVPQVLEGFVGADGRHDVVVRIDEVIIDLDGTEPDPTSTPARADDLPLDGDIRRRRAERRGGSAEDLVPVGGR